MQVSGIFSLGYDDCDHGYRYKKRSYGRKKYGYRRHYKSYGKRYYKKDYDDDDGLLGIDIDL